MSENELHLRQLTPAALGSGNVREASGRLTRSFYATLRREVLDGESALDGDEIAELRGHYPIMMRPERYPPRLVAAIYAERRAPAVAAIMESVESSVFDAGCGFGSESFLFAAAGARVLAVDRSPEKLAIARKRQGHYEELFGKRLEVTFAAGDLDAYEPDERDLSLTWLASVLAAIQNQEALLRRIHAATRTGGRVMITDMNLLNPLFALNEWRRRYQARQRNADLAGKLSFPAMFFRRRRRGARYLPDGAGEPFDDAQFFWWRTLAGLLRQTGFEPERPAYSGFVPPLAAVPNPSALETALAQVPLVRCGGYFYLMSGVRQASATTEP